MFSEKELSNELKLEQKSLDSVGKLPRVTALVSLFTALVALSFAAIFIRLSELEIGSNATIFNRLWIATLFFGLWNSIKQIQAKDPKNLSSSAFKLNTRHFSFFNYLEANPKPDLKRPNNIATSLVAEGLHEQRMNYEDLILSLLSDRLDYLLTYHQQIIQHIIEMID
ncbi:hypothetical protein [Cylindrospermopsis raciborskii]|uniref:hypothetical protein n=1 Tax=Cylindrospermopsis raciborskii TaxID=77022 RepID=UPI00211A17B2|nr:hypothetical protein [Cylindrospermopsis raciborskii]